MRWGAECGWVTWPSDDQSAIVVRLLPRNGMASVKTVNVIEC